MANVRVSMLIVDDDPDVIAILKQSFEHEGYYCDSCSHFNEVAPALKTKTYDVILLDLFLGDRSGIELIQEIHRQQPRASVIVMTAFGTVERAVAAMERGASTFINKDNDLPRFVADIVDAVNKRISFTQPVLQHWAKELIGHSPSMQALIDQLERIIDIDVTVLLLGESGTGKELVARVIHQASNRAQFPMQAVNCGAIPENLLESELFGVRKGAFTDARSDRPGIVEICNKGTLLLDEIGDLPLHLQVKLLRFLQEKEIMPVGGLRPISVDTRVIAATNKDLEKETKAGRFREDLYFRLNVFPIHLPALRERKEDIPQLVEHFVGVFNKRYQCQATLPPKQDLAFLQQYAWPGNVRELQHAVERAVVLAKNGPIKVADFLGKATPLEPPMGTLSASSTTVETGDQGFLYSDAKEQFERAFLLKLLRAAKGSVSEAARLSGRYRSDIYRLMERYAIASDEFKNG